MNRVAPTAPPPLFDERCRDRGRAWLEANPTSDDFPAYWTEFRPALRGAFHGRCAYLGLYIAKGTVDHFLAKSRRRELAYEWSNYRYADSATNAGKKPDWDGKLIDPFEVDDEWFEILLPSCQLRIVEAKVPPELLERVKFTVQKLKLEHDEELVSLRSEWLQLYENGGMTLETLDSMCPQLARAISERAAAQTPSA